MEPVTQKQALNGLSLLERMRLDYKSHGRDGDPLREAMGIVNRFIHENPKPINKPKTDKKPNSKKATQ